ncbi:MAG: class I SAM-dependent methyltransferase [Planctomycetes bacterium]|nr:class I SAM-dependent methyltransferase [Planctomycetota bacterium]
MSAAGKGRAGATRASRRDPCVETLRRYEEAAGEYLKAWDKRAYRLPPLLARLVARLPRGARVLDLGCGPGQDCRWLRRRGLRPVGMDGAPAFLARARLRSPALRLVRAGLDRPPFRAGSFRAIWAAASLIHLPRRDARRALRALFDLLPPGGVLAATFTHRRGEGFLKKGWIPGRYFCYWLKPALADTVTAAGFDLVSLEAVANRERKGRWLNLLARRPRVGRGSTR